MSWSRKIQLMKCTKVKVKGIHHITHSSTSNFDFILVLFLLHYFQPLEKREYSVWRADFVFISRLQQDRSRAEPGEMEWTEYSMFLSLRPETTDSEPPVHFGKGPHQTPGDVRGAPWGQELRGEHCHFRLHVSYRGQNKASYCILAISRGHQCKWCTFCCDDRLWYRSFCKTFLT